jgi:hypothetical protein
MNYLCFSFCGPFRRLWGLRSHSPSQSRSLSRGAKITSTMTQEEGRVVKRQNSQHFEIRPSPCEESTSGRKSDAEYPDSRTPVALQLLGANKSWDRTCSRLFCQPLPGSGHPSIHHADLPQIVSKWSTAAKSCTQAGIVAAALFMM